MATFMVDFINQDFVKNKELYNQIARDLSRKLGNCPINHVGSTAIPNMKGKNIIDILIGAKDDNEFNYFVDIISNIGYFPSSKSKTNIYQFFASSTNETGSGDIHIHLSIIGTDRYEEFLILRDYLLSHPEEAKKYSDYKKQILADKNVDRKQYRSIKSTYVSQLIETAKNVLQRELND